MSSLPRDLQKVKAHDGAWQSDPQPLESSLSGDSSENVKGRVATGNLLPQGLVDILKSHASSGHVTRATIKELAQRAEEEFSLVSKVAEEGLESYCCDSGLEIIESPPPVLSGNRSSTPVTSGTTKFSPKVTRTVLACLVLAILFYFYYCSAAVPSSFKVTVTVFACVLLAIFLCYRYYSGPTPLYKQPDKVLQLSSGVTLGLIYCEPGTFTMGSPEGEFGRWEDEIQHEVTLSQGFYLGQYEVTCRAVPGGDGP